MSSNINLDGGEVSIVRALGFGSAPVSGRELKTRLGGMPGHKIYQTIKTLISVGYIISTRDLNQENDFDRSDFHVNSGYAKDLKEAIDPNPEPPTRRVRRQ